MAEFFSFPVFFFIIISIIVLKDETKVKLFPGVPEAGGTNTKIIMKTLLFRHSFPSQSE